MKTVPLVLSLSLVANLALGAAWFWRGSAVPVTPLAASSAVDQLASIKAPPAPKPVVLSTETWRQLSVGSDAEFVARLRMEGFPPALVRNLAYMRLYERHAEQFKKFWPKADYAYWRRIGYSMDDELTPELRAERRALNRQMADEARQLLGDAAGEMSATDRAYRNRAYGDLPKEKIDQLSEIDQDYRELTTMVRQRTNGLMLPEDRAQLAALEAERRADLAATLTPAELAEYNLRASPSARAVQSRLRFFDATEEEYRALATLQMDFDKTYGGANPSGAQQQQRVAAQAELTEHVKALLTPERFAEYEIRTDSAYGNMTYLLAQTNPSADVMEAVRTQRDLTARYNALRNDRSLAPEARNAQLDTLAAEARTRMAAVLGPKAYESFSNSGGPINSLINRKTPKP